MERRDQREVLQGAVAGPGQQGAGEQPAGGAVAGAPRAGRGAGGGDDEQRDQPRLATVGARVGEVAGAEA